MATTTDEDRSAHPIGTSVRVASGELTALAEAPLWSLDAEQARDLAVSLASLSAQVAELEARVVAHADELDVARATGARSTAAWLAHHTRVTGREAHRKVRLARSLARHEPCRQAVARGRVHVEQAHVIADAVEELTTDRDRAEQHLLTEAAHHDATGLRRLGRRILEVLDPARADAHEARLLERQEARARAATRFTMSDDGQGTTHGRFTIPTAQASMLHKMLTAHAAPKHVRAVQGAGAYQPDKPTPARMGQAFCDLIERYPVDRLPSLGGLNPVVVATVDHQVLLGEATAARLDTGEAISPGQLRRWACEAGILPAVMGGPSEVLDLGRRRRLHTSAQRVAIAVEQQTCQHPTCQTPAAYCHVHHTTPWSRGGPTTTRDAVLLCPFHHHRAHATGETYPLRR